MKTAFFAAAILTALSMPAHAADGRFADPAAIDREVEQFTGAAIGTPGGARAPVDRRLRLARCSSYLAIELYGSRGDSVAVRCPDAGGWRIFVPLVKIATVAARSAELVSRGDSVSIAIEGRGFSILQTGEAMEGGGAGDWIAVQPPGKVETVRARIERPGKVVIPVD